MIQWYKNCFIFALALMGFGVFGMQPGQKGSISYSHAIMKADMTGRTDWLEIIVQEGVGLNARCEQTGLYPLHDFIRSRYGSHLVVMGMRNGARADLKTNNGDTLFHCIARCPKTGLPKEHAYFQQQNLLSALALPTYIYPEDTKKDGDEVVLALEQKRQTVKTFLLCLKRPEVHALHPVKWCILAQMPEYVYCPQLFSLVLPQMHHPEKCIMQFPFAWFARIAQRYTGDDRTKFLTMFAPLFARYRLVQAQRVLQEKNNQELTAYQSAQRAVEFLRNEEYPPAVIQAAHEMVEALKFEEFVDRHMPACTLIIKNMLEGKEPFDGFELK